MTTPDTTTPVPAEPAAPAPPVIAGEPTPPVTEPVEHVIVEPPGQPAEDLIAEHVGDKTADDEPEKWVHPEGWEHQWIDDFHGDRLAIKIPTRGMTNAIMHAQTTSLEFQQRLVAKFESEHISEATRERVLNRMIDGDDPTYTGTEWDDLTQEILRLSVERSQKEDEALAEVKAPKKR